MTTSPSSRRVHVVGLGLIGSSVALALKAVGWYVSGADLDDSIVAHALDVSLIEGTEVAEANLVVVATPARAVLDVVREILLKSDREDLIVTDVAGVKGTIVAGVSDPRFLGGHPMAGSELRGLAGARADLFEGCTWVLTPTQATAPSTYGVLHGILREIGANVVAVGAFDHDRLVAVASHVPHLLAGTLMNEATDIAEQDAVLLQLAAGGFRDMTRIAAGDPSIWPDVLFENRDAVTSTLDALVRRLDGLRTALATQDRSALTASLTRAAEARRRLPGRALDSERLAYLRVRVSDEPGVLAAVTVAASELLVNIYDIEIAHGIEGTAGTLLLAIDADQSERFMRELTARGFSTVRER